jgi:hypothetical protein
MKDLPGLFGRNISNYLWSPKLQQGQLRAVFNVENQWRYQAGVPPISHLVRFVILIPLVLLSFDKIIITLVFLLR